MNAIEEKFAAAICRECNVSSLEDMIDEEEQESEWEKFCRRADEEYDLHCGEESFFAWSRREDGYHF